jgi:PTS system nitrogen regulatory IIA component
MIIPELVSQERDAVLFLVITSPDNPSLNLQILAAIVHLVRQSAVLKKMIMGCRSLPQTIEIIREEEEKLNE